MTDFIEEPEEQSVWYELHFTFHYWTEYPTYEHDAQMSFQCSDFEEATITWKLLDLAIRQNVWVPTLISKHTRLSTGDGFLKSLDMITRHVTTRRVFRPVEPAATYLGEKS